MAMTIMNPSRGRLHKVRGFGRSLSAELRLRLQLAVLNHRISATEMLMKRLRSGEVIPGATQLDLMFRLDAYRSDRNYILTVLGR